MSKAIILNKTGNANQLKLSDWKPRNLNDHEVEIKQTFAGVNYVDIYFRSGIYKPPYLPIILGREATGEIIDVGKKVLSPKIGDRVCYVSHFGGYSERNIVPADITIPVPNGLSDEVVAGVMLKGMTVQYLLTQTYKVTNKTKILIHAAAGGVGLIACQWAKHLGATVIGTVGSEEKAAIAKQNGCDYVINYEKDNIEKNIIEITNGILCDAVIDGIGKKTWEQSIKCVRPYGKCITFGLASGPLPNIQFEDIPVGKYITRGTVGTVINDEQLLEKNSKRYFKAINDFIIKPKIYKEIKLENAREAHEILEKRVNIGSIVLKP
ncbi:quinone oxidoreductase [Alphaproteobacteria bacterium]|nr:quinone oxidoreductase [Alphaproteobacteria bacterium]